MNSTLTKLNQLAKATTEDYGKVFESCFRAISGGIALFLFAGQLTREYWEQFKQWSKAWTGDPFAISAVNPNVVAAPVAPPKTPPTTPPPVEQVSRGEERTNNNAAQAEAVTKAVRRSKRRVSSGKSLGFA